MRKVKRLLVGAVKCPKTGKPYGVVFSTQRKDYLIALQSFPIVESQKDRFAYQKMPRNIKYLHDYDDCPYCHQFEDLYAITNKPKELRISVTAPHYDDIGAILNLMKIKYKPFSKIKFDCDVLFINCGTSDLIDEEKLEKFVYNGGCVYASDWADQVISDAFGEHIIFSGRLGKSCKTTATVLDDELREILGNTINVSFDLGGWAMIRDTDGEVMLLNQDTTFFGRIPIMVKKRYGDGTVFYTSFHNHSQADEKERALLQLLVLKQFADKNHTSMREAGRGIGFDVDDLKKRIG